jgi:peptidyl-prolyl cis-trans isomerase C
MVQIVDTSSRPPLPEPAIVSVNGVVIARDAIAGEIQNHPASKPQFAWQQAAQALVIRELLLQEARRLGIAARPAIDNSNRRETEEEALLRGLIEAEVAVPEPDEQICRRYYEQNRARFRSADIYEAAHILFAASRDDLIPYDRARLEAKAVLAEIRRDPSRFADLAKAHSACPSGEQGGNLGQITAEQTTPEFEQALFKLAEGEVGEPVATRYGWHIIRLGRKIEGRELPFEFVTERIADYLREQVTRRASAQYIARLVSSARITGIDIAGAEAHRVN